MKSSLINISILLFLFTTINAQIQIGNPITGDQPQDWFGTSVAFSSTGNRIVVGATGSQGSGFIQGQVKVLEETNGGWVQVGNSLYGGNSEQIGSSVAMSSDGMRFAVSNFDGLYTQYTRIYEEVGGAWVQIGSDIFTSVSHPKLSMSGDGKRVSIADGQVRVFEENNGIWSAVNPTLPMGSAAYLSESGHRIAIGDPTAYQGKGKAQVYEQNGGSGNWYVVSPEYFGDVGDNLGKEVTLSADGRTMAFSAPEVDHNGIADCGRITVFGEISGIWQQLGSDIYGTVNTSGYFANQISISSDGSKLAFSTVVQNISGTSTDFGQASIYENISGTWTQLGNDILGTENGDFLGFSIALSNDGERLAIGAPQYNTNGTQNGYVNIYEGLLLPVDKTPDLLSSDLLVYPNPTNGIVNFELQTPNSDPVNIRIIDQLGKIIWEDNSPAGKTTWNDQITLLHNGVYFIQATIGSHTVQKQIVVAR